MPDQGAASKFLFTKLVVRDLEAQTRFYREVFDYQKVDRLQGEIGGRAIDEIVLADAAGKIDLILMIYEAGAAAPAGGVILGFLAKNLEAFEQRVLRAGGGVHQAIGTTALPTHEARIAFYTDPEGNLLEIIEG